MDFGLTDEQQGLRELAERMFREHGAPDRLAAVERDGGVDDELWQALAAAGLLGLTLPEGAGGAGMGMLELHLVLEEAGAAVAHVPLVWHVLAAMALADADPDHPLLARAADGSTLLSLALQDEGATPGLPTTRATADGDGWRLDGTKLLVPVAGRADHLVVSATTDDGRTGLFLVTTPADVQRQRTSSDEPLHRVVFAETPATAVGEVDGTRLPWLLLRAQAAIASLQSGVCRAALRLAADHTSTREQFGRPIATFQAVSQRVADAFIDVECLRLTALQAAWRIAAGRPAEDEVAIAKYWTAESGHRVLHACHHVHGGIGVDREYPLYRYLMRAKQYEFTLGTAADELARLGAGLAAEPA